MPKSNVEWFSASRRGGMPGLSVDKSGRIILNSAFRSEIKAVDVPVKMYLGYDTVKQRIHLAPADTEVSKSGTRPYTFDKSRGSAHVRAFLDRFKIPYVKTHRYVLIDRVNGAYVFESMAKWTLSNEDA